jgi:hypothetical protein
MCDNWLLRKKDAGKLRRNATLFTYVLLDLVSSLDRLDVLGRVIARILGTLQLKDTMNK